MSYFKTISMLVLSTLVLFGFVAGPVSTGNIHNGNAILTGGEGDDPVPPPPIILDSRSSNQVNPIILGGGEGDDPVPPPPIIGDGH